MPGQLGYNRFRVPLSEAFPVFTPSPEAESKINLLMQPPIQESDILARIDKIYEILIEDQNDNELRVHKGNSLYWRAQLVGNSDKEKALESMLAAFVEDILTHGRRSIEGFAGSSLQEDFRIGLDKLFEIQSFVLSRTKNVFDPYSLVKEYLGSRRSISDLKQFEGVSEVSKYEAIVRQIVSLVNADLRASFKTQPQNEMDVQNALFILLRQIDPDVERERHGARMAEKEYIADFSVYHDKISVEVKVVRRREDVSKIIEEINADIRPYLTFFKKVVFVVLDNVHAIPDHEKMSRQVKNNDRDVEAVFV